VCDQGGRLSEVLTWICNKSKGTSERLGERLAGRDGRSNPSRHEGLKKDPRVGIAGEGSIEETSGPSLHLGQRKRELSLGLSTKKKKGGRESLPTERESLGPTDSDWGGCGNQGKRHRAVLHVL